VTNDREDQLDKYLARINAGEVLSAGERQHYQALCEEWLDEEEAKYRSRKISEFI
jgi:ribosome assembly protein YihI (activator of Der GTPase)